MKSDLFKSMWETMQKDGYFRNHSHYADHFGYQPTEEELAIDAEFLKLDFSEDSILMPSPYSDALERSAKRTESQWLFEMFDLPNRGTALDLGCGFGRTTNWMAGQYEKVFASDISATVIEEAKSNLGKFDNIVYCVNEADSIPADIAADSLDIAYIFTVFQHIHREFSERILREVGAALKPQGKTVFNLISNVNEMVDDGVDQTEWAIGYSEAQAKELVAGAGLQLDRIVRWYRPEHEVCWLWVCASKS